MLPIPQITRQVVFSYAYHFERTHVLEKLPNQSFSDFGIEPGYVKMEGKFRICSAERWFVKGKITRPLPK